jgi:hypothetical protein
MRMLANIEGNGLFGLAIIVISVIAQLISTAKKHTAAAPTQQPPPSTSEPEGTAAPSFEEFLRELTGQKAVPPPPEPPRPKRPPLRHKPQRLPKLSLKVVAPPAPPMPMEAAPNPEAPAEDLPVKTTGNDAIHYHKKNVMTSTFRRVFQHKRTARQAVLLTEILGQPLGLRQPGKANY